MSTNSSNAIDGVTAPEPPTTGDTNVFKEPVDIHFDGSHSTGKNAAAIGFVITDANGSVLTRKNFEIDYTTSVQTEFKALTHALQAAKDLGVQNMRVYGDSLSVIELARGDVETNKPALKTLTHQARTLLTAFDNYYLNHVKRSQNSVADSLAHTALDNATAD